MDIYLIRHGETRANREGMFVGRMESPLTKEASGRLKYLSQRFESISLDRVFSSPRRRALDTARAISKEVEVVQGLAETDFGIFEGRTYLEISTLFPEEARKMGTEGENYAFPEGEKVEEFYRRVFKTFERLIEESEKRGEERIALVSHAGVIRTILSYSLLGTHKLHWNFKIEHTSVTKLNHRDGFYVLECLNDNSY